MTEAVADDERVEVALLPHQLDALEADEPMVAYVGGLGAGKTEVGTLWAAREAVLHPTALHVVSALTNDQLSLVVEQRLVEALARFGVTAVARTRPRRLVCDNDAEIQLRSIDKPEPLGGAEIDRLWADEADFYPARALRILRERMRGRRTPQARSLFTSTPNGFRELYRIFVKEAAAGRTRLIQARTRENFFLPADYVEDLERAFRAFPGLADQQLEGKFVAIGGTRVSPAFDRAKHASTKLARDPSTALMLCFDFNVGRIVCHLAQERMVSVAGVPTTRCEFLRPIRGQHLDAVCDALLDAVVTRNERGAVMPPIRLELYGDAPQGSNRSPQTGVTGWDFLRERLARFNPIMQVPTHNPLVVDRAVAWNSAVAAGLVAIDPSCVDLIEDCEKCAWDESGKRLEAKDPERTHAYDSASYLVHRKYRPRAFKAPAGPVDYDLSVAGARRG